MSAKKKINKFGERAIAAMIKEFKQIHEGPMPGKPVVRPVDPHTLSLEQKKQALEAVTLIKVKRSGMLKGRTCVNGKKQKLFLKENGRSVIFHSVVAKLLHLSKRARPDIEPTVAFLCTRVSKSTEEDWKKLGRVLRYLNDILDMKRVIGGNDMSSIHTWVDTAYAVHENKRSQTGGCLSFGRGMVHTTYQIVKTEIEYQEQHRS